MINTALRASLPKLNGSLSSSRTLPLNVENYWKGVSVIF